MDILGLHSSKNGGLYESADTVLDHLRQRIDRAAVRADVSALQQIFHDEPPAIFIAWPKVARVVSANFAVPEDPGPDVISSIWQWRAAKSK